MGEGGANARGTPMQLKVSYIQLPADEAARRTADIINTVKQSYPELPEKIFAQVTVIIMRARARAKASEALGKDLKNVAVEDIRNIQISKGRR